MLYVSPPFGIYSRKGFTYGLLPLLREAGNRPFNRTPFYGMAGFHGLYYTELVNGCQQISPFCIFHSEGLSGRAGLTDK